MHYSILLQAYSTAVEVTAVPAQVGVPAGLVGGMAQPLCYHWFYLRPNERYWIPFSLTDSAVLEQAWATADPSHQVPYPPHMLPVWSHHMAMACRC